MVIGCLGAGHFGTALNLTNACQANLAHVLDWPLGNDEESKATASLYLTIVSSTSVAGVSLGSVIGGSLIQYGRRKMYILFSLVGIVGCAISTVPNMTVMCIGRFIYGFASGIFCVAGPRIMNEIVPTHLMDLGFNSSTNVFINIFTMISMLLGLGQPTEVADLKTSSWYKVVYLVPVIFCIAQLALLLLWHKSDSIHFHIVRREKETAMGLIAKVYPTYDNAVHEQVYKELESTLCPDKGEEETAKVGAWSTLFGREHRAGTWVCIFVASANTLAGVNLVNQYAKLIYDMLNEGLDDPALSPSLNTYIVGVFGFFGALMALVTVRKLSRRALFIAGHTGIAISLGLCILFSAQGKPVPFLIFHCMMIVSFQASNGAGFWLYAGEVANEQAMGICLLVLLGTQLILSIVTPTILNAILIPKFLVMLLSFQVLIVIGLVVFLKETKGLNVEQLYNLYRPSDLRKIQNINEKEEDKEKVNAIN